MAEPSHPGPALRRDHTVLCQMTAKRVDRLGALTHEHLPGPEQHGPNLALLALHFNETHGGAGGGLGDRLGVGHVVLLTPNVGLHILCRDQPHGVVQLRDLPAPAMRRRASFHGHHARRFFRQKGQELRARQLLPESDRVICAGAVELERALCQANTDDGNILQVDVPPLQ